ncbi:hypothetical protein RR49_01327 [Microbacterium ginsengisoli]|uniref:Uncharacterized protein n=1 Tax=Microbacterium ginsengisoli TaxID=400772 RepID=A0A0F0M016_9MICO|nr:hypothetical protein [Microbacterium ginsengisoli]KJL36991.1 hypothetical protein RR49_01327 [Microbacterium ginsengisoli]
MDVERNGGATTQESFFAPVRRSLAGIIALSVIGAISGVIPFIAIVELARTLLPALAGGEVDAGRMWTIVVVAVAALFVSFGAAFLSGMVSHLADAELQHPHRPAPAAAASRLVRPTLATPSTAKSPLWVAGSSPRVHQLARYTMPPSDAVWPPV